MKILMLTPYLPYPLYSGGQIRSFNLLKNLSKNHQITLFSFIRNRSEKEHLTKLSKYCVDVKVFFKRPPWSFTSLALSAITYYPLVVCMYLSVEVKKAIAEAIAALARDPVRRRQMSLAARQKACERFSVKQTVDALLTTIRTHYEQ